MDRLQLIRQFFKEKHNRSEEELELIELRKRIKQLEMGDLACEA